MVFNLVINMVKTNYCLTTFRFLWVWWMIFIHNFDSMVIFVFTLYGIPMNWSLLLFNKLCCVCMCKGIKLTKQNNVLDRIPPDTIGLGSYNNHFRKPWMHIFSSFCTTDHNFQLHSYMECDVNIITVLLTLLKPLSFGNIYMTDINRSVISNCMIEIPSLQVNNKVLYLKSKTQIHVYYGLMTWYRQVPP